MVHTLKIWWSRLSVLSGGKWLFGKIVGFFIPYTGSVSPVVLEVGSGLAKVCIKDHRKIRNHLNSIHALALCNLGEFTTGLAIHFAMDANDRAILTCLRSEFYKKARGTITATSTMRLPTGFTEGPLVVEADLFDDQKNLVAKVSATWLIGKVNACNVAKI